MSDRKLTVGAEAEGHIIKDRIHAGEYHYDSSVDVHGCDDDCDGSCRDNCDCYMDCDCNTCRVCTECGDHPEYCCCVDCLICGECSQGRDDCECAVPDPCCEQCVVGSQSEETVVCDSCRRLWRDEHFHPDCYESGNMTTECDRECSCQCQCECDCGSSTGGTDGEVVSIPMAEDQIEDWFRQNEPAIHSTNSTCGLHIHVGSLKMSEYGVLMDIKFHRYLRDELIKWGHEVGIREGSSFFRRLDGRNSFCKDEFRPYEQKLDTDKSSSRYCIINYCWRLHETMEVRVLPCFQTPEFRIKATKKVLSLIHSYLDEHKPKIHSLEIKEVI